MRHIAVDTEGRLLMVNLTAADMQDAAGGEQIVQAIRKRWPWLKHLFADGADDRGRLMGAAAYGDFVIEVVRKLQASKAFRSSRAAGWWNVLSHGCPAPAASPATMRGCLKLALR